MSLPASYQDLLRRIGPLNRVHNGEEMARAVVELERFCKDLGRGRAIVHSYKPGSTWNNWIVPKRWKVRDFQVTGADGRVVASLQDHPLALCPYSCPADVELTRGELIAKTVTRPDLPDSFSFYFGRMYRHWERDWNISLPKNVVDTLPDQRYRVRIETELTDEPMLVFEYLVEGRRPDSIVLAAHLDHP